jgi:transposase
MHYYPYFKGLVDRTADAGFTMKEVSADKGYLGASNMLATLQRGVIPYIPFKSNSVGNSRGSYGAKSQLWSRMYHFYMMNRPQFLEHYHKRSNVETTFHMWPKASLNGRRKDEHCNLRRSERWLCT